MNSILDLGMDKRLQTLFKLLEQHVLLNCGFVVAICFVFTGTEYGCVTKK